MRSVLSYSTSRKTCQLAECAQPPGYCFPFQPSEKKTPTHISSGLWPEHPHLNAANNQICTEMQQWVYLRKVHNVNRPTLWHGWHGFQLSITNNATDKWCKHIWVCVFMSKDDLLSILNLITDYTPEHFNVSVWWKLQVSGCYWINIPEFHFSISQGSVATYVKCGGKHDNGFIANFLLNSMLKEFWKSTNICKCYERIILWVFFDSQCIWYVLMAFSSIGYCR